MEIALTHIVGGVMAVGLRVSGLVLFAPFLGSSLVPARIKALIVILITGLLYPVYAKGLPVITTSNWVLVVITEMILGVAMGIATNMAFEAAQMAGQVLSIQMGYSLVNILDPQTQVDTTVLSIFFDRRLSGASTITRPSLSASSRSLMCRRITLLSMIPSVVLVRMYRFSPLGPV
jgi:flagellar biosynthetic protein FliR